MMQAYRTEGNYRSAARLSPTELRAAMANREILQATALAFDTQRQLRFEIGGVRAVMPFAQCADGAANGTVRDIAVLTRVGRPTCFVIEALDTDENGQPFYRLSRALAQQMCKADYLDTLQPGDILCFYSGGSYIGHVGIYIGDGENVHAQNEATGVIVSALSDVTCKIEARRILIPGAEL